jgi:drug/metabolite transporter (DMT)-like permease
MKPPPTIAWRADAALLLACLFWGVTFVLVQGVLPDASPAVFLAFRFALALLLVPLLVPVRKPVPWAAGATAGVALWVSYWLQTEGLRYTTPSKSAFITGMNVVLVPVLVSIANRRWLRSRQAAAALVATVGLGLLTLEGQGTWAINWGDLLTLGCALAFSVHVILVGRYANQVDPGAFLAVQLAVVAALSALTASAEGWPFRPTPALAWAVVITAALPTAAAFALMIWAQRFVAPSRAALLFTTEPVFAAAASYAWLGERFSRNAAAGAILILVAIWIAEAGFFRGRRKNPEEISASVETYN